VVLLQLDDQEDKENIMAIAPNFTTGLLGYNPREEQLQQQKLWAGLYGQASSPYEKIGIGVGQLGGALIGGLMGESATQKRERTLLSVKEAADQQFIPGSPEYYKFVADNLPAEAEYSQSRDLANQEFVKARKAALAEEAAERKSVREDPESLDVFAPKYATPLLAKAQLRGFDPEKEPVPQTTAEIKAFAKLYDLDKDPNYNKLMGLRTLAEKEAKKEEQRAEKEALTIEQIQSTINKNKADLGKIASDKFEAGNRWNEERNSAIALFDANKLDPRKPLKGINLANPALVKAQEIALRDPWTGKSGSVIKQPGGVAAPPTGAPNIKQLVESSGQVYDTDKYDYRIVNGQVQRRAK
jgi:hypothetical protein